MEISLSKQMTSQWDPLLVLCSPMFLCAPFMKINSIPMANCPPILSTICGWHLYHQARHSISRNFSWHAKPLPPISKVYYGGGAECFASFPRCWTVTLSSQNQDQGLRKTNQHGAFTSLPEPRGLAVPAQPNYHHVRSCLPHIVLLVVLLTRMRSTWDCILKPEALYQSGCQAIDRSTRS